jgi:HK97 family phage portal protein
MPALAKAFNLVRSASPFPAFSGVNGQIEHSLSSRYGFDAAGSLRVAAIWIAITVLADEIASLSYRILKRDDRKRVPQQPPQLKPLWSDDPNDLDSKFSIDNTETISLMTHGASYTMLNWQGANLVGRWPQPPEACSITVEDWGLLLKCIGKGELENRRGAKPQFMYIPLYTLPGEVTPISPIAMAAELAGLSMAYQQTATRLMERGLNPSALVTADEAVDDAAAASIARRLERLHGGARRAGGVAVIGGKGMKLERLGMTLQDAEFIAQNEYVFKTLLAMWRVPPTVAGMVDKPSTWGTGVAEFSRGLERFTLRPIVQRRQSAIQKWITSPVDPSLQVRYIFDSLLSAAPKDRSEIQRQNLMAGLTSVERVQAQNDEPPFEDDETVFSQLSFVTDDTRAFRDQRSRAAALGEEAKAVAAMHLAGVPLDDAWKFVNPDAPFLSAIEEAPPAPAPGSPAVPNPSDPTNPGDV